ncbi:hypothetical protein AB0C85_12200 [Streptomyces antimycoticus]
MGHTTPTTLPPTGGLGGFSKSEATDNRAAESRAGDSRASRPGWLLAIVLTGQLMAVLDVFIVNIAAPAVRADLHAPGTGLQLVIAGYAISYAVLLILGPRLLHEPAGPPRPRGEGPAARRSGLDLPGPVLLAAAVLLFTVPLVLVLVLVLVLGQERGWPLWGWNAPGMSAVLVALFAAYETRLARRGGAPLISPRVVRAPGMPLAVIRIALGMAANAGFLFAMTPHVRGGLGYSPLRAGLTFVPTAVAFGVVGLNWQRLSARWQAVAVPGGFLLAAASFAGTGLVLRGGTNGGPWLLVALTASGAGLSFAYSPLLARTLATVRRSRTRRTPAGFW